MQNYSTIVQLLVLTTAIHLFVVSFLALDNCLGCLGLEKFQFQSIKKNLYEHQLFPKTP